MGKIAITGVTGRLGSVLIEKRPELKPLLYNLTLDKDYWFHPEVFFNDVDMIIHCAAFTDVRKAEKYPSNCSSLNILGTYNLFRACEEYGVKLITISTDHIFDGERGNYTEDSKPTPIGIYAQTKKIAEDITLLNPNNTVIRTSFIKDFTLPKAFVDKYFSGDTVDVIADEILKAIDLKILGGIWNIATEKKTIYDVAKKLNKKVGKMKLADNPVNDVGLKYLKDVSLDTSKWKYFKNKMGVK